MVASGKHIHALNVAENLESASYDPNSTIIIAIRLICL